jgi:hypothetical protein
MAARNGFDNLYNQFRIGKVWLDVTNCKDAQDVSAWCRSTICRNKMWVSGLGKSSPWEISCSEKKGVSYPSSWAMLVPSLRQKTRSRVAELGLHSGWRAHMLEE